MLAVLYAISFLVELAYIALLDEYLDGTASVRRRGRRRRAAGVQFLAGVVSLVAAGFFIAWMYRAYGNLSRTSVAELRYDTGWAIGAWFIPVCRLDPPEADDRRRLARRRRRGGGPRRLLAGAAGEPGPALVVGALGRRRPGRDRAALVGFDDDGILTGRAEFEREQTAATIAAPGMLCLVAAAILACIVIRRITDRGERVREAVLAQAPDTAPHVPEPAPEPGDELIAEVEMRCPVCGWVFRDAESGREHLERHHARR